jgi:hypothetical protein
MSLKSWIGVLRSAANRAPAQRRLRKRRFARPLRIEGLEDRSMLSFVAPVSYSGGGSLAGDFNNDGRLDLAGVRNGAISVLLGNASGTFQAAVGSAAITGKLDDSGDFNADGRLDLVGTSASGISLFLGNGNGTFQAARNTSIAGKTLDTAAGDFNGDGRLDLGAASYTVSTSSCNVSPCRPRPIYTGFVRVFLGSGDGSFSSPVKQQLGGSFPTPSLLSTSLRLDDFNEDGRDDLAIASSNRIYLALGNDNGLLPEEPGSVANGSGDLETFTAADINGDSHLDLVTGNWSLPTDVRVHLGRGDGTFNSPIVTSLEGRLPNELAAGDFNGDGQLDLAAASNTSCATDVGINCTTSSDNVRLTVLLGQGDGGFTMQDGGLSIPAGLPNEAVSVAAGAFNGDAFTDVVFQLGDTVLLLRNDGIWPELPPLLPSLSISDATVIEGNTGTRLATFTVTLSPASNQPVTVSYTTANGTATSGSDYLATAGTLTFAPGQTSKIISVSAVGDRLGEVNETFGVVLSNADGAVIADATAVGTIADDEPRIRISDASSKEGKSGTKTFTFTVSLSAASDVPVTVDFGTADGTDGNAAASGIDYVATEGTLTFAAGQTSKTVTVQVKGDKKSEPDEIFYINLSGSLNALIEDEQGIGTIVNDD